MRKRLTASVILSVCDSICPHDKTKTTETEIIKLGTGIVHQESSHINEYYVKRLKVKVTRSKNAKGDRVAGVSYALYRVLSL